MPTHPRRLRRSGVLRLVAAAVAVVGVTGLAQAGPALAFPAPLTSPAEPTGSSAARAAADARPAAAAAARKARPLTASFFGVHHQGLHADGPIGFPQAAVGSVRMWDNKVSWRELETAPGVFDWTLIDMQMAKVRAHGATALLVLGQTPTFHSTRPGAASSYGAGASAMPTQAAWTRYVQAVAQRNRTVWGGIASFQVWNEANVIGYWSGTPAEMAQLTAWTRSALQSVDRSAVLAAPALVTRLSSQQKWNDAFYAQRIAGRNVSSYVDAVSFQLYPVATGTPESSMTLLASVRAMLARHRVSKPIWNTEVNYGLVGGPSAGAGAAPLSTEGQVGNVMRTYVLNAGSRVGRVYWYSWDLLRMSNTTLVQDDRITPTAAGQAFGTVRSWLLGSRPAGCARSRAGTWTCTFTTATQTRRVVWNPDRSASVVVPRGVASVASWTGASAPRRPGSRVTVGPVPVLITSRR